MKKITKKLKSQMKTATQDHADGGSLSIFLLRYYSAFIVGLVLVSVRPGKSKDFLLGEF